MSRPSSSVPNQCADDGGSRRVGRWIDAGSCGAIQGANRAKMTKTTTSTAPVAASGLWRGLTATRRRSEMAAADIDQDATTISQVGTSGNGESFQNQRGWR